MRLSLCMATFNEEKNIHIPLDSAYDLVDEVIVVDGQSTDKTVEIAKSYGSKVKVYLEKHEAMFHINKQKAIDRAKGEWILQLDADESLSDELKEEIKSILTDLTDLTGSTIVAYYIPRKNFFLTRFLMKGGQYPDYTIRLYKNGVARFPCNVVHENVEIKTINNHQLTIGYLKNPILHYADPDFSRYLMRWDRYTTLEIRNSKFEIRNKNRNKLIMFFEYFIWKPTTTFFSMYFRHKGFMDGFPGFIFALFSSIRFWLTYIKYWVTIKKYGGRK